MTSTYNPIAEILAEAERNRRLDRAAAGSSGSTSTAASTGDSTVDAHQSTGNVVVLDANGKIPPELLYAGTGGGTGTGTPGVSPSYDHVQAAASTTWTIAHNLGGYPPVVIVDGSGTQILTEIRYPDTNHVLLLFGKPRAGVAHLTL